MVDIGCEPTVVCGVPISTFLMFLAVYFSRCFESSVESQLARMSPLATLSQCFLGRPLLLVPVGGGMVRYLLSTSLAGLRAKWPYQRGPHSCSFSTLLRTWKLPRMWVFRTRSLHENPYIRSSCLCHTSKGHVLVPNRTGPILVS